MYREMLRAKIFYPTITQTELYYEGSITIDENIMKAADIREHEKVDVLNVNNGERFYTYVIKGKAGSGVVCVNGPAARKACVGDKIIVLSYCQVAEEKVNGFETLFVKTEDANKISDTFSRKSFA